MKNNNDNTNMYMNGRYTSLAEKNPYFNFNYTSSEPNLYIPEISEEDTSRGYIDRYFVKQITSANFPIYEVDVDQYETFKENPFYDTLEIKWRISDQKYNFTESDNSYNRPMSVAEYNSNQINFAENKLVGMVNKLKNPLEFYKKIL